MLAYRRLESHHNRGTWSDLKLPPYADYEWFQAIQKRAHGQSEHTIHATLARVCAVAQELQRRAGDEGDLVAAVEAVSSSTTTTTGAREVHQRRRRFYHAANFAWYDVHRRLPHPLEIPRTVKMQQMHVRHGDTERVFSATEIDALVAAAHKRSALDEILIRLLFTTGLRIAAAASITWGQVMEDGDSNHTKARRIVLVREKGNAIRTVLLCTALRDLLESRHGQLPQQKRRPTSRVFPQRVRALRNHFYAVCRDAGQSGSHCHPHTARHSVAHLLFLAKNPVAMVAKFLGHRSLETTNNYYLRLSFQEILANVHIPWEV